MFVSRSFISEEAVIHISDQRQQTDISKFQNTNIQAPMKITAQREKRNRAEKLFESDAPLSRRRDETMKASWRNTEKRKHLDTVCEHEAVKFTTLTKVSVGFEATVFCWTMFVWVVLLVSA